MKQFDYVIKDPIGLHARPAGLLVKLASSYQSKVTLEANGKSAECGKLIMLIALGIKQGTKVTCRIEGEDEEAAAQAIQKFIEETL